MDTSQISKELAERVRIVSSTVAMPPSHERYLRKLKSGGFHPKVIYDIGACVLHWTKVASRVWPDAKIIPFDAFTAVEGLWIDKGIKDYHIGVLSAPNVREVQWYENPEWFGGNSYYRENNDNIFPADRFIVRETNTLDTVVEMRGFPLPDLIKIDVQGSETDIIRGGNKVISSCQHLIVEIQKEEFNLGAPQADSTIPYIESLGFKCVAPLFSDNGPDGDYGFSRND